ncbi:hypothetical protein C9E85_12585 [Plesiomonas shigelloides]|nr:hypothetical protein C9E85_12585 [Plesiomonas shigelloides]
MGILHFKTFVISLSDAKDRRNSIATQLKKINMDFEIVDAVDLRNETSSIVDEMLSNYEVDTLRPMTRGEIGCSLSHKKAYGKIIDSNFDFGLILEDDALINESLCSVLNDLLVNDLMESDVLILGYSKLSMSDSNLFYIKEPILKKIHIDGYSFGSVWREWTCGTVGYLLSRRAAEKMLKSPIISIADDWYTHKRVFNLDIIHCRPGLIFEDYENMSSSIESERLTFVSKEFILYKVARIIRGQCRMVLMKILDLFNVN